MDNFIGPGLMGKFQFNAMHLSENEENCGGSPLKRVWGIYHFLYIGSVLGGSFLGVSVLWPPTTSFIAIPRPQAGKRAR